jgi:hypothetical protein
VTISLTLDQVRRRTLAAQALTNPVDRVESAVVAAAGVYGSAPTSHFSLAARVDGYRQSMLETALVEDRSLLRVSAMRSSVYLLPTELAACGLALLSERNFDWYYKILEMSVAEYRQLADRIEALLSNGPLTTTEIRKGLGSAAPEGPRLTYCLRQMGNERRILKAATRGGIRSQRYEYVTTRQWVDLPEEGPTLPEALAALTPLWLRSHGPATVADLAWWAGVKREHAVAAIGAVGAIRVEIVGLDGEVWALEESLDAATPDAGGVVLLPVWDVFLMSHRDRRRYLADEWRDHVVDASGNVANAVIRDGVVVGVWDFDGDTLLYGGFGGDGLDDDEILAAAGRFAGIAPVSGVEAVDPQPLAGRGQNEFQTPLRRLRRSPDARGR